jgi:hypothetical protein
MTKLKLLLPLAAGLISLAAWPAYAHGFGERTELPIPLGFFMIGAAIVVAASFVVLSLFLRSGATHSYWRFDLLRVRVLGVVLTSELFLFPIKLLAVSLLGLVVATGLVGDQSPTLNFAPTFVWIIWWVGMAFVVALVGNLWALVNPWKIIFQWSEWVYGKLRAGRSFTPLATYPRAWGVWPALVLFAGFVWAQDAYPESNLPNRVALMVVAYTVVTLGGMAIFGRHTWLRYGEAFSVIFRTFARFSPTEVRIVDTDLCQNCSHECLDRDGDCVDCYECFQRSQKREFNLRPFAIGLGRNEPVTNDLLAVVVVLLATVTFDGFSATSAWVDFQSSVVDAVGGSTNEIFNSLTLADTLGVLLFPVGFLVVYLFFSQMMAQTAQEPIGVLELARLFAFSLIPIALAYNIAHFITLLLIQGQLLIQLVSDPFGFGWDLFGTIDYTINIAIINARVVWFLSLGVIVVGHVLAVYLAHIVAVRTFSGRSAVLSSQYPMLTLMVVYTVISLWIIAQPIVA